VFANESAVSADVRTTEGERERASERERETESCQRRGFGVVRRSISQGQILPTAAPVPPVRSALCPPIFACERVCACVCVLARARVRAYSRERERQREKDRERERGRTAHPHIHTQCLGLLRELSQLLFIRRPQLRKIALARIDLLLPVPNHIPKFVSFPHVHLCAQRGGCDGTCYTVRT
jgi:hypothetical protein